MSILEIEMQLYASIKNLQPHEFIDHICIHCGMDSIELFDNKEYTCIEKN